MNVIISTSEISIEQDKTKNTLFTIKSNNSSKNNFIFLLNSLIKAKIVQNSTIIDNNSLMIKAFSIQTLEQIKKKMSHTIMLNLIYYLSKQLSYLINFENKCFYTYDPKNVIIIDNKIFAYLSQEHLVDFNNKNSDIYIYSPISKENYYLSPELSRCIKLPVIINYKTIFYSLGLLLLESLLANKVEEQNLEETIEEKMSKIESFKETKIYYFLERALNAIPDERFLLYI